MSPAFLPSSLRAWESPWLSSVVNQVALSALCGVAEAEIGRMILGSGDRQLSVPHHMFGLHLTLESLHWDCRLPPDGHLEALAVGFLQEKLKGGKAIVQDDVAAGVLAHLLVRIGLKILEYPRMLPKPGVR